MGKNIMSNRTYPKEKIQTTPMGAEWKQAISDTRWWASTNIGDEQRFFHEWGADANHEDYLKYAALHDLLVKFGGEEVCFAYAEPDLDRILDRGRFFGGKAKMRKGKPSQCHRNAARIWEKSNPNTIHIATGYALSADGMWRAHSWLVDHSDEPAKVIETTMPRVAYFGFEMTNDEAAEFCRHN